MKVFEKQNIWLFNKSNLYEDFLKCKKKLVMTIIFFLIGFRCQHGQHTKIDRKKFSKE